MLSEIEDFYFKLNVQEGPDKRTQEDRLTQKNTVQRICKENQQILGIVLTPKKGVKYPISKLQKIDLGNGVYCNITDNKVKSQQAIITIHGVPGGHAQWAGLQAQMKGKYRWINFIIPGLDGQDQRRGPYTGDNKGLNQMFLKLIIKLQLKRITIICHSFGTSVGHHIAKQYPHLIQGYINIGGMTRYWPLGMTLFYKSIVCDHKYYEKEWKQKKLFNIDSQRNKIYEKYVQSNQTGAQLLKFNEYFGFLKLSLQTPNYYDNFFRTYNLESSMLRVNVYGSEDPIMILQKVQATIYQLIFYEKAYPNSKRFKNLLKLIKNPLEKKLLGQFGIKIEGQRIQEYFNFIFEETGHAIHRRRPEQLSRVIRIYLASLQVIYEQNLLSKTNL